MATLREIKGRINSIRNTEKITRAMKMVAAVKFRKAQENILSARPYAYKLTDIIKTVIPTLEDFQHELLTQREIKKVCLVVVTSDRGLCGSFNTNLIKAAENAMHTTYKGYFENHNLTLITIGKKAYMHFHKRDYEIFARYTNIFDQLEFSTAQNFVTDILTGYNENKFDKIVFIYHEFKSAIQTRITEEQFLPIQTFESENTQVKRTVSNFIFEPSTKEIIDFLLPKHLNIQVWRILLESNASEQASRMTAMEMATKNANDLMAELQLYYNKARQASITKEILEVVSGAEALRISE